MIRSVKMEYMRGSDVESHQALLPASRADFPLPLLIDRSGCLVAGHRAAKTNSAKRMFALEQIEAAADEVLRVRCTSLPRRRTTRNLHY